mgnify:CR=1 FL=1
MTDELERLKKENAHLRAALKETALLVKVPDEYIKSQPELHKAIKEVSEILEKRNHYYPNGDEVVVITRNGYIISDFSMAANFDRKFCPVVQALADYPQARHNT